MTTTAIGIILGVLFLLLALYLFRGSYVLRRENKGTASVSDKEVTVRFKKKPTFESMACAPAWFGKWYVGSTKARHNALKRKLLEKNLKH